MPHSTSERRILMASRRCSAMLLLSILAWAFATVQASEAGLREPRRSLVSLDDVEEACAGDNRGDEACIANALAGKQNLTCDGFNDVLQDVADCAIRSCGNKLCRLGFEDLNNFAPLFVGEELPGGCLASCTVLSGGAIAGIVLAVVAAVTSHVAVAVFLWRRKKKEHERAVLNPTQ